MSKKWKQEEIDKMLSELDGGASPKEVSNKWLVSRSNLDYWRKRRDSLEKAQKRARKKTVPAAALVPVDPNRQWISDALGLEREQVCALVEENRILKGLLTKAWSLAIAVLFLLPMGGCSDIAEAQGCKLPAGKYEVTGKEKAGTCGGPLEKIVSFKTLGGFVDSPPPGPQEPWFCVGGATPLQAGGCTFTIRRDCHLRDETGDYRGGEILKGTFSGSYHLYGDATVELIDKEFKSRCKSVYESVWWHQ